MRLMPNDMQRAEFCARYWIESAGSLQKVADVIAGEQSSGTFLENRRRADASIHVTATPRCAAAQPAAPSFQSCRSGPVVLTLAGAT
jgi:ribulose-bisphosphate carboxylase large chain